MANELGHRHRFEPELTKKGKEPKESPEKAIREHLDSIKNPLLSELPEGGVKEFLLSFFKKAEAQLKEGGGPELGVIG